MSGITEGMASAESYSRKTPVHQPTNCLVTRTHAKDDALVARWFMVGWWCQRDYRVRVACLVTRTHAKDDALVARWFMVGWWCQRDYRVRVACLVTRTHAKDDALELVRSIIEIRERPSIQVVRVRSKSDARDCVVNPRDRSCGC
jgi:hypothetical protein